MISLVQRVRSSTVADLMASRWAYEALSTNYFINNEYEKSFYQIEKVQAQADFKAAFLVEELKKINNQALENLKVNNNSGEQELVDDYKVISNNLTVDPYYLTDASLEL